MCPKARKVECSVVSRLSGERSGLQLLRASAKQLLCAKQARRELAHLKRTLERLTVPQQREILGAIGNELVGGVFRREPLRLDPHQNVMPIGKARRRHGSPA
jgi:hypothetical protein